MSLRLQKKERVRADIARAAEALFRERGYGGTRIRDIIERVGISEKTFFNYFGSKESLVDHMQIAWYRDEAVRARAEHAGGDAADDRGVLEHFVDDVRAQIQGVEKDRDFAALLFARVGVPRGARSPGSREKRRALRQEQAKNYAVLRDIIQRGQARGEIREDLDPQEIAEHYVTLLNTTVARWAGGYWDEPGALEPRVMRAIDVLLNGLRPRGSERESARGE